MLSRCSAIGVTIAVLALVGCDLIAPFNSAATDAGAHARDQAGDAPDGAAIDGPAGEGPGLLVDGQPPADLVDTPPDSGQPTSGAMCTGGWCWSHPPATAFDLRDVWVAPTGDSVVVGPSRFVLRFNGSKWSALPLPSTLPVTSIWGTGPSDIHVGTANNTALYWNGTAWASQPLAFTGTIAHLGGRSSTDVFALFGAAIWRHNGQIWSALPTGPSFGASSLLSVAARRLVAGDATFVAEMTNAASTWKLYRPPTGQLSSLWADDNAITVGTQTGRVHVMLASRPDQWKTEIAFSGGESVVALWGSGPALYAAGTRGKLGTRATPGTPWQTTSTTHDAMMLALDGRGGIVTAVGALGTAYGYSNGGWRNLAPGPRTTLTAVSAHDDTVYAVGAGGFLVRPKGTPSWRWVVVGGSSFVGVWTNGALTFAVSESGEIHEIKANSAQVVKSTGAKLTSIGGVGSELFAVGAAGSIYMRSGSGGWFKQNSGVPQTLRAVDGVAGFAIAVGVGGTVVTRKSTWSKSAFQWNNNLNAVLVFSASDAWVAGEGIVARFDGQTWQLATPVKAANFRAICGTSSNKIIAVTDSGSAYFYDGKSWSETPLLDKALRACRVDKATRRGWVVGRGAAVLTRPF